jgi:hypothetical protein
VGRRAVDNTRMRYKTGDVRSTSGEGEGFAAVRSTRVAETRAGIEFC